MTLDYEMSHDEYAALPGVNWSRLKLMRHSPLHYMRTPERDDTASLTLLRAVHCAVLEPAALPHRYVVYEGRRDTRTKAYQAFLADHPEGTEVLKPLEMAQVRATARAVMEHPDARRLLAEGSPEVTMQWRDPETGIACKGRADWIGPLGLIDLKTIGTTDPEQVGRMVHREAYHGQLAHYEAGLRACGVEVPAVYLIVAEGKGAHDVGVFRLDDGIPDGALHVGRQLRRELLDRLAQCLEVARWPGRCPEARDLCLPGWALDDAEVL